VRGKGTGPSSWTPDRPARRGAAPALVGQVLVGTQEYIAQRQGALMSHEEWRRIVGPQVASRSRVGGLLRGTLTIKVASSAWANELSFLRTDIIERLSLAGHDVTALRFRVDPSPFQEKVPERGRAAAHAPARAPELPRDLEAELARVDDPNLRAAIREAAAWSLGGARASGPAAPEASRTRSSGRPPRR